MIFEMEISHNKVHAIEIDACERRLNFQFHEAYKNFLLNQNGGMPINSMFKYNATKVSSVNFFFGINVEEEFANLEENFRIYRERLPNNFLPIAGDPGGNLICMGGENKESIYFWLHEAESSPPTMKNMYLIANTFQGFLESLEPDGGEDW